MRNLCLFTLFLSDVFCNIFADVPDEKRLRDDLLHVQNWTVRPVKNFNDRLNVNLRFKLIRISELNVKDQLLTLNVKIEQEWIDYKFQWDPDAYGGISQINIPTDSIWLPDFQLYNKFSDFEMQGTTAMAFSDGKIVWTPSAILQTFCEIEVRFYPFDIQTCSLQFGSWTHDGNKLYITLMDLSGNGNGTGLLPVGMVLKDYYPSAEWDLISIPAENQVRYYPCCPEPYMSIHFNVTLRRHPHFYLVNLVMPLVGLSYLSLLVFYLPADSGEKITLCVSVLTSQVMFLLLMINNIPVTSLAVPLLGKIIVFNMVLVFLSVFCTTIVLNVYYRKPSTHSMPGWVRRARYTILPKLLLLEALPSPMKVADCGEESGGESSTLGMDSESRLKKISRLCSWSLQEIDRCKLQEQSSGNGKYAPGDLQRALRNVCSVRNHMQRLQEASHECEDWKLLASILDRIFLIVFNAVFIVGTVIFMMDAPALYDHRRAIDRTLPVVGVDSEASVEDYLLHENNSEYEVSTLMVAQGVAFYD